MPPDTSPSRQDNVDPVAAPAAGEANPVDLSIVIPAWNEAESLEETIGRTAEALRANEADGFIWEIIVCDNASTDGTSEIARRAGARVVFEPERGIAHARNAGARAARGEWLLFIDADSYPTPELLTDVRMLLGDERIVGCGATMWPVGGKWWMRLKIHRDSFLMWCLGMGTGVFILCRHGAFRAIGGFSADLYALEELDFVFRLRCFGWLRGLRYRILHRHPVVTSARTKAGFLTMFVSYVVAFALLLLHILLPKRLRIRIGRKLLGFWYSPRS